MRRRPRRGAKAAASGSRWLASAVMTPIAGGGEAGRRRQPPSAVRRSTGVEALLPLVLELLHGDLGGLLLGPYRLQGLGQEVAAGIDGELRPGGYRDLADRGERHPFDEGTADVPGRPRRLVVGPVDDRLPRRGA